MAELKTNKTAVSAASFLKTIKDEEKRGEAKKLLAIFKEATGMRPKMWGGSIVGFGSYHYKSERSRQEGDWPLTGFSPRKQNLTIYIMPGFSQYEPLLKKLGPHKKSVGCLYLKRLADVNIAVLLTIIKKSVKEMQKRYPGSTT